MVELTRSVRFCLSDGVAPGPRHNGYSAWPAMRGLGRYYQLRVTCQGQVDPQTGYFLNIKTIDQAVREHALPHLSRLVARGEAAAAGAPMGALMRDLLTRLGQPLHDAVARIDLDLTPLHRLAMEKRDMEHVILYQQFDFSAAHRLHVPELSADENRRVFGKCNNPSGHGHNYRLEVGVRAAVGADGHVTPVEQLDALVDEAVIQKLDHKHLNVDVPEFAGLNPSVENIARVIWEMLAQPVSRLGLVLDEVRVWETEKTVCVYRGRP